MALLASTLTKKVSAQVAQAQLLQPRLQLRLLPPLQPKRQPLLLKKHQLLQRKQPLQLLKLQQQNSERKTHPSSGVFFVLLVRHPNEHLCQLIGNVC